MHKLRIIQKIHWVFFFWLFLILMAFRPVTSAESPQVDGLCFSNNNETIPPPKPQTELSVIEGETSHKTYQVKLCSKPQYTVTVSMDIRNSQDVTINSAFEYSPTALFFDADNYSVSQSVEVWKDQDSVHSPLSETFQLRHMAVSFNNPTYTWSFDNGPLVQVTVLDELSSNVTKTVYLPLISRSEPPKWEKFTSTDSLVLGSIALSNNKIFVGDRSTDSNQGLYSLASCKATIEKTRILSDVSVLDLYIDGENALLGTFNKKAYFAKTPFETKDWQQTQSNMNSFVYGVARDKNGKSYAGTDNGLYESQNNGLTFALISAANNPKPINAVKYFKDLDGDSLWIATNNAGVLKYTISNSSFQNVGSLPGTALEVFDIVMRSQTEVYIATRDGVYKWQGSSWSKIHEDTTNARSLALAGTTLFVGKTSNGILSCNVGGSVTCNKLTSSVDVDNFVVRDLYYDESGLCKNATENRNGLLAATSNGLWVYR